MSKTVSEIVREGYGAEMAPGGKFSCPKCGKNTFSINAEDTLGTCFHPDCTFKVRPAQHLSDFYMTDRLLTPLYEACLAEFERQDGVAGGARDYVIHERKIDPDVARAYGIGAIPASIDLIPVVEALRDEINTLSSPDKKKTSKEKQKLLLEFLETAFRKLQAVTSVAGAVALFYRTEYGQLIALKVRRPFTKDIFLFKPISGVMGVFGNPKALGLAAPGFEMLKGRTLVFEGDFNPLRFQSALVRRARSNGLSITLPHCVAVGGVSQADYRVVGELCKHPIFCYDNDLSEAGYQLLENARQTLSVEAFTTPEPDSDADNFFGGFADEGVALEAFARLIEGRQSLPRHYDGVREEIFYIRQKHGPEDQRREFEINSEVLDTIKGDLKDRGAFFHDKSRAFFFLVGEKKLVFIGKDNSEITEVLARYGLVKSETIHKYITAALREHALAHGTCTDVHKLGFYDQSKHAAYVYDGAGSMYKITPDAIAHPPNGTDGVLFEGEKRMKPFKADFSQGKRRLLENKVFGIGNFAPGQIIKDEYITLLLLWLIGIFMPQAMRTRVILAFLGPKGSGKSFLARLIGMILYGRDFEVTTFPSEPKDFDAAVTGTGYVVFDNADESKKWLCDKLATAATGGSVTRRELYTTMNMVTFKVRAFLALTSRTPQFNRDDVADRLAIFRMERLTKFADETTIINDIMDARDQLWGEILLEIQGAVRALRDNPPKEEGHEFRMADFASFSLRIARNWGREEEVHGIFEKLAREQSNFTLEGEPIMALLSIWVPNNERREVTNATLCGELAEIARREGIDFPYEGRERSFSQKMSNLRANLDEFFEIGERTAKARKKFFTFKLKGDQASKMEEELAA